MKKQFNKFFVRAFAVTLFSVALVTTIDRDSQGHVKFTAVANASDGDDDGGGESGGPYKGKVCGLDPCERQYGVPPYVRVNHGHVAHCQTATSGHCSSSDCFVNCDA